jgi:hypothetical protein
MEDSRRSPAEDVRKGEMISQRRIRVLPGHRPEVLGKSLKFFQILSLNDERIGILAIQFRQGPRQVANVRPDAEVLDAAAVNRDVERHRQALTGLSFHR